MTTQQQRAIDPEIMLLSGEIFPAMPALPPDVSISPLPELPPEPVTTPVIPAPIAARRPDAPAPRWERPVLTGLVLGIAFTAAAALGINAISPLRRPARAMVAETSPVIRALARPIFTPAPTARHDEEAAPKHEAPQPAPIAEPALVAQPAPQATRPLPAPDSAPRRVEAAPRHRAATPAIAARPVRSINTSAAATAIAIAAAGAGRCLSPGDPRVSMPTRVTFAPSGRVTTAVVTGGPFAGSQVGGCIATALRNAHVGAFEGPPVTVLRTIMVR